MLVGHSGTTGEMCRQPGRLGADVLPVAQESVAKKMVAASARRKVVCWMRTKGL